MSNDETTERPAPRRIRGPVVGRSYAEDRRALSAIDIAGLSGDTPIPASVFLATVAKFESEIEELRSELKEAHAELARAREDLGEVLALLRAQADQRTRFWDHAATICTAFANDGKVRLVLVAGFVLAILVSVGVSGLSWRDGALTISAPERNMERAISPMPEPLH